MVGFAKIEKAALKRVGESELRERLKNRLVPLKSAAALRQVPDDRYLSLIGLRIFRAGLKHDMVDAKWPAFEAAFHGFDPHRVRAMRIYGEGARRRGISCKFPVFSATGMPDPCPIARFAAAS